jgi:hypothetical protein
MLQIPRAYSEPCGHSPYITLDTTRTKLGYTAQGTQAPSPSICNFATTPHVINQQTPAFAAPQLALIPRHCCRLRISSYGFETPSCPWCKKINPEHPHTGARTRGNSQTFAIPTPTSERRRARIGKKPRWKKVLEAPVKAAKWVGKKWFNPSDECMRCMQLTSWGVVIVTAIIGAVVTLVKFL